MCCRTPNTARDAENSACGRRARAGDATTSGRDSEPFEPYRIPDKRPGALASRHLGRRRIRAVYEVMGGPTAREAMTNADTRPMMTIIALAVRGARPLNGEELLAAVIKSRLEDTFLSSRARWNALRSTWVGRSDKPQKAVSLRNHCRFAPKCRSVSWTGNFRLPRLIDASSRHNVSVHLRGQWSA